MGGYSPPRRVWSPQPTDGSRSYQAAIAQYLPDARHVLDRFHVVRVRHEGAVFSCEGARPLPMGCHSSPLKLGVVRVLGDC